nr:hypothetical protein [Tanacetum cinerariifolium]
YAPSITRGIISVSGLYDDGYVNRFVDNAISVSRNTLVYFSDVPRDGIFEIDLSNPNAIDSYMYASFWDYALETAARILNMVSTKKVEKTPYEVRIYMENSKRGSIRMQEDLRLSKSQGDLHWTTVKNILKYLGNTKDMFLVYGCVVDWKSTKQSIFTTSSAEAEYISAYDASNEAV